MTQENKDKELLDAIKELAASQTNNACCLRRGRRFVDQLRKAASTLEVELNILDPDSDVRPGPTDSISYPSPVDVSDLLSSYKKSAESAQRSREFIHTVHPCLKL